MKNAKFLLYLIVLVLSEFVYYLIFGDYIISSVFAGITTFVFAKIILNGFLDLIVKEKNIDIVHRFVNSMIIQLGTTSSIYEALCYVRDYSNIKEIQQLEFDEKNYFGVLQEFSLKIKVPIFNVFLETLRLQESQGSSFLLTNKTLLDDLDLIKVKVDNLIQRKKRKMSDFLIMWILFFIITLYLRLGLSEFYLNMINNVSFIGGVGLTVLLFIGSNVLFFSIYRKINIEEGGKI